MLLWSVLLLGGVGATAHLYRHMGVLLASQATVMLVAALADTLLLRNGVNPSLSLIAAVGIGVGIGLIHLPVLLQTGAAMLLILTAVTQLFLIELWNAIPQITGGSSGFFLPDNVSATGAVSTLLLLMGLGVVYLYLSVTLPARHFDWSCLKTIGKKSGAFGVPSLRLYAIGLIFYGAVLAAAGVAGTRFLGYLTVSSFGLTWSIAVIMIVLSWAKEPVLGALVLSVAYITIRVLLRQSVYASETLAYIFEIAFPLILLVLMNIQARAPKKDVEATR
jgi:hypothetical protein